MKKIGRLSRFLFESSFPSLLPSATLANSLEVMPRLSASFSSLATGAHVVLFPDLLNRVLIMSKHLTHG